MKPYLERSADASLQLQLSKVYKEVDNLYDQWLQGKDDDVEESVFEEEWVDDGEEEVRLSTLCVKRKVRAQLIRSRQITRKITPTVLSELWILNHVKNILDHIVKDP